MHNLDVPIILMRPPDYHPSPPIRLGEPDIVLENVARMIFAGLEISSFQFVEPPMPNQGYLCLWSGSKDGIEYEVQHGEGPHAKEYPFWIWVGLEHGKGYSDRLSEQANLVAERFSQSGWHCLVRGYISATGELSL
jgi:hypothetical protein